MKSDALRVAERILESKISKYSRTFGMPLVLFLSILPIALLSYFNSQWPYFIFLFPVIPLSLLFYSLVEPDLIRNALMIVYLKLNKRIYSRLQDDSIYILLLNSEGKFENWEIKYENEIDLQEKLLNFKETKLENQNFILSLNLQKEAEKLEKENAHLSEESKKRKIETYDKEIRKHYL